jgi:hypothetical protein
MPETAVYTSVLVCGLEFTKSNYAKSEENSCTAIAEYLRAVSNFDSLRGEARFTAILERLESQT